MPRQQSIYYKYKCTEPMCGMSIRGDKWQAHIRAKHKYKAIRNMEIRRKIIEVKKPGGTWEIYRGNPIVPSNDSVPSTNNANVSLSIILSPTSTDLTLSTPYSHCSSVEESEVIEEIVCVDNDMCARNCGQDSGVLNIKCIAQNPLPLPSTLNEDNVMNLSDTAHTSDVSCKHRNDNGLKGTSFSNDPSLYSNKKIESVIINLLLSSGPCQPDEMFTFPKVNGRSFQHSWFQVFLPDNSKERRNWLTYSKMSDKAYCLPCLLFTIPGMQQGQQIIWSRDGYMNWTNASRDIVSHERSTSHKECEFARIRWIRGQTIDSLSVKQNNEVVHSNREVVACVIESLKYLSTQMLALRGHSVTEGNFYHIFEFAAKYNPYAASYLEKVQKSRNDKVKMDVNFISNRNVARLLEVMKETITSKIAAGIHAKQACSLIVDSTQDVSKQEATSVLLRYIEVDDNGKPTPVERLLEVFTSGVTTGVFLKEKIMTILQMHHIQPEWIIGQALDGAGNMSGKLKGLKTLIQKEAPKALYVWCHSHRLNLVIAAAMSCNIQVKNAFGILQELYEYFCGHKRHDILLTHQQRVANTNNPLQLKRVQSTRWTSLASAVNTVKRIFRSILSSLDEISSDPSMDVASVSGAIGLAKRFRDFKFIITICFLHDVFQVWGPIIRHLQGMAVDLTIAVALLSSGMKKITDMRNNADQLWTTLLSEAECFAQSHGIVPQLNEERSKRRKRMDGEICSDERSCDGLDRLRVEMYICTIDSILAHFQDRFNDENQDLLVQMSHFSSGKLINERKINSADISKLCDLYELDAGEISSELADFRSVYKGHHELCHLADAHLERGEMEIAMEDISDDETGQVRDAEQHEWHLNNFLLPLRLLSEISNYVHLKSLYKILVSIPATSCSAERAFSRLKIIKNRLRSSMGDPWLSSLMIIAAEKDIIKRIPNDELIERFALCSSPLSKYLLYN